MKEGDMRTWMLSQIAEAQRLHVAVAEQVKTLEAIVDAIVMCLKSGSKVLLFGNGGSAASAEHWAAELTGRFYYPDRKPLSAIALSSNVAQLTAIANDFGYEAVYERLVEAIGSECDVVIGISTSGRSPNVLRGLAAARENGCEVVGFTGMDTAMERVCHYLVSIPSLDTPRIQELHDHCAHLIFAAVERRLFG